MSSGGGRPARPASIGKAGPPLCHYSLPQNARQVLGQNLKSSESRRACPSKPDWDGDLEVGVRAPSQPSPPRPGPPPLPPIQKEQTPAQPGPCSGPAQARAAPA